MYIYMYIYIYIYMYMGSAYQNSGIFNLKDILVKV